MKTPGPNLLGRDWLREIKESNPKLQKILNTHEAVFGEGLGTLKGTQAKISVDPSATPKFVKSRMKALARSYVWWPGIDQEIVKEVKCCDKCQSHQTVPAPLGVARSPIDCAGPYKGELFLVVVDAFSK